MDEGFDFDVGSIDTVDVDIDTDFSASDIGNFDSSESIGETDIKPFDMNSEILDDMPIEESFSADNITDIEMPISEQEMTELQEEAASLEIPPLDEAVQTNNDSDLGLYDNIGDMDFKPFDEEVTLEQSDDTSALSNIRDSFFTGFNSEPSELAQAGASVITPHGTPDSTTDSLAQFLQGGAYAAATGSAEIMEGTIDTYGRSPAVELNELQIQQAIDAVSSPLDEPLRDNEDYFDENGVNITDESLRE